MMLQQKTTVIDLNWLVSCGDIFASSIRRTAANEQRTNSVFANTRFHPEASIQNLRQSIRRKLSGQIILMFRSISDNGFCSTYLSRKLKRHRNLFESVAQKTLSLRLSWKSFSQQFSQFKRKQRLADLSRFCTGAYQKSKAALCQRRFWCNTEKHSLCSGRNSDRSMLNAISMGSTSKSKKCSKAAYTDGLKRLNTDVCTHYKRLCTRGNSFSNDTPGIICHLRNGQGLHRFCNIIQFFKEQLLLYYQGKKEYSLLSKVLSTSGQEHGFTKRPDNKTYWHKNFKTLPDTTEANHISRRRTAAYFCVPDKQFSARCVDCMSALQTSLADRTVLQVDQTTLANKVVLRNFNKRSKDPGLDCDQRLRACSDNQKGTETGAFVTRNTPNYKYPTFRENPAKTSTYG